MQDLVQQGREELARPRSRKWVVLGLVLAPALALVVVRGQLVSSGDSGQPKSSFSDGGPTTAAAAPVTAVVVRQGDRLERYAGGRRRPLGRLPTDLPAGTRFVPVEGGGNSWSGPPDLVAADGTVLFRADSRRARPVTAIGRGQQVLGTALVPGHLFVVQPFGGAANGPRVVEIDSSTGDVVDQDPFPGYVGTSSWQPTAIVSAAGAPALLMSRPADSRVELAVAWPRHRAPATEEATLVRLGAHDLLVGVAENWVVTLDGGSSGCGADCRLEITMVTRDQVLTRQVDPPPGWRFGTALVSAENADPLISVVRADDPSTRSLARLVAGGQRAILVTAAAGAAPEYGMVGAPGGMVVFAVADSGGVHLTWWSSWDPARAARLDLPDLPADARLICVC